MNCRSLKCIYLLFHTHILVNSADVDISQKDPRWVGAWWLGFMIIGAAMLLWTLPVVMFPGKMSGEAERGEGGSLKSMAKGTLKIIG